MSLHRGTPAFRSFCAALFAAGFSIFSLLYAAQALLPAFTQYFHVSPATSSLTVSLAAAAVAISIIVSGSLADSFGRRGLILGALVASALLTLASAATRSWGVLLACRALMGLALGCMPSVLIAYVTEEVEARSLGFATGLYISGSVFGGMAGRLVAGLINDAYGWRMAFAVLGAASLLGALHAWRALPPSQHFVARRVDSAERLQRYLQPLRDEGLPWIFVGGALMMGGFITVYNYMGFRLLQAPYRLSQSQVSLIFTLYLLGMASSTLAGSLVGRFGRRHLYLPGVALMLTGVLITFAVPLWAVVVGVGLMTFGFFGAHSVASSWVGVRGGDCRAQAASLYLCGFYVGSGIAGWVGGVLWGRHGWAGVGGMVAGMEIGALAIAVRLARLPPLPRTPATIEALTAAN